MEKTASNRFPAVTNRWVLYGGLCWTMSVVFFAGQAIVQGASTRPFSLTTNLISDLGNTACGPTVCSPLHTLMNAIFILVGLLHWAGAVMIRSAWPQPRLRMPATVLVSLAGWGLAYAGVFPENVAPVNHAFGALLGLACLNLGMLVVGVALVPASKVFGGLALGAGIVGGLSLLLFLTHAFPLTGLIERIADYPGAATIVLLGTVVTLRSLRAGVLTHRQSGASASNGSHAR